jgi:hypothetical protein
VHVVDDVSLAGFGSFGVEVVRATLKVNGIPMSSSPTGTMNFAVADAPGASAPNVQIACSLLAAHVDVDRTDSPSGTVPV